MKDQKKDLQPAAVTTRPDYINLFEIALKDLKNSLSNAAAIYGKALEKDPRARENFERCFPNHREFFNKLEAFYKGMIREDVFFIGGEVGEKIRRLPMPAQTELVEKGVELLTADGNHMIVRADTITPFQARQIISNNGTIRNLKQQKAWMESQKSRKKISAAASASEPKMTVLPRKPYEVKDGVLYVYGNAKFDKQMLFDILREML